MQRPWLAIVILSFPWSVPFFASSPETADAAPGWPQWRGAGRDAVSTERGLVDGWGPAGPRIVWRTGIGAGYSGVSVEDGRLYTLWDDGATQYLFCLDASSGKLLWRRELGPSFDNPYGNGPRSTPLLHRQSVFAVGTQGRLIAADRETGELLWKHDLVREYAAELPAYGYASSPMVTGGRLIVEVGGADAAFMAFEADTGRVAWATQKDAPAYSSPIEISVGEVRQVVFWSAGGLHALAPDDGGLLWKFDWETPCPASGAPLNTGTPIFIAPDRVFLSSASGAAVLRISQRHGSWDVETVWRSEAMRSDVNTAVLLGSYIYGFDRGFLQCIDVRTGEVLWKARGFGRGSLIAADGKLLVLGERGNVAIVDASPEGFVEKASAEVLDGRNWTSPSLAAGKLYLRNHEELVCVDLKK